MRKGHWLKLTMTFLILGVIGCATNPNRTTNPIFHEFFRSDEKKNLKPLNGEPTVDYKEYDQSYQFEQAENRAYLKGTSSLPAETIEETVAVPPMVRYNIPAINASYIEDGKGGLIVYYKSRVPPPDLISLITGDLAESGITTSEFPGQNALIFKGKKESFGDFGFLANLLNHYDIPLEQIRVRLKIIEYFNDNTYDRELTLNALKNQFQVFNLNLPSSADQTQSLTTGVNINPFWNRNQEIGSPGYFLEGAVKFLDSHGKTTTIADVDAIAANGKTFNFSNRSEIPYPESILVGNNLLETLKYKETGVSLEITAYANENGFITIFIKQGESGEQSGYVGTLQRPVFRKANFTSEFTVKNGIPFFAAASLNSRYKSVDRGIPGLNKIPLIKDLSTSRSIEKNQSQLIYLIEARVIPRSDNTGENSPETKFE